MSQTSGWHPINADLPPVIVEKYGHDGMVLCDRTPDDDESPCQEPATSVRFPVHRLRPVFACGAHRDWLTEHDL